MCIRDRLGIGERTGNIPLEAMVMEYASLRGSTDGMDTKVITEIAEFFREKMNYKIPPMTPFVGADFNVTRAGIHADGLMKDEEIYNIFDTKNILGREPGVTISKTSGAAGIAYWLNQHESILSRLGVDKPIGKEYKIVAELKEWVDGLYADNRTTVLSNNEIFEKLAEMSEGRGGRK